MKALEKTEQNIAGLQIENLITFKELVKQGIFKRGTLYYYTSNKLIPFIKIGRNILFNKPELEQWLGQLVRQVRHEITEQQRKENNAQHLPVSRGLHDIGRDHAVEYFCDVSGAPALRNLGDLSTRTVERQQLTCRLAVDITRTDQVNKY